MGRKSCTVSEAAFEALAAHKADDESWSDVFERAAEALESDDGDGENEPSTVQVENVDELARATADEVENRMTRR